MIPGGRMNPRQMKQMMRRMGIEQEEIEGVEEVVIRTATKEYIFTQAQVTMMTVQGPKAVAGVGGAPDSRPPRREAVDRPRQARDPGRGRRARRGEGGRERGGGE